MEKFGHNEFVTPATIKALSVKAATLLQAEDTTGFLFATAELNAAREIFDGYNKELATEHKLLTVTELSNELKGKGFDYSNQALNKFLCDEDYQERETTANGPSYLPSQITQDRRLGRPNRESVTKFSVLWSERMVDILAKQLPPKAAKTVDLDGVDASYGFRSNEKLDDLFLKIAENMGSSAEAKWKRANLYLEARKAFTSNRQFGEWLGELSKGLEADRPIIVSKLLMCATYLTEDQFMVMGFFKSRELMVERLWRGFPEQAKFLASVGHKYDADQLNTAVNNVLNGKKYVKEGV